MRLFPILCTAAATALPAFAQLHVSGMCGPNAPTNQSIETTIIARIQPVTGAPYSATQSSRGSRTTAAGTHIANQSQQETQTWRDSLGRVRTEMRSLDDRWQPCDSFFAQIEDPVAGYLYLLDLRNSLAYRVHLISDRARSAAEIALDAEPGPRQNAPTVERLGTKTMLGVNVDGKKTTEQPRRGGTTITETWTAPKLALVIYQKETRPELGDEQITALEDLSTAEPAAALFQVPAAYRLVDEPADNHGIAHFAIGGPARAQSAQDIVSSFDRRDTACGFTFNFTRLSDFQPVTGAPYAARESNDRTEMQVDGSEQALEARHGDAQRTWRDVSGRVRQTVSASFRSNSATCDNYVARLEDPLAGYVYVLDSVHLVAHRVARKALPAVAASDLALSQQQPRRPAKNTTTEPLGSKTISGVTVVGTRETTVVPAGAQGNDKPLTNTEETWYAPSLALRVSSKTTSWTGSHTIALNDLTAGDPDPALFRVPAGYKVVDEAGSFTIAIPRDPVAR